VSLNKPPSVIADWHALYRHSKSPHSSSLRMLSWEITIIIIIGGAAGDLIVADYLGDPEFISVFTCNHTSIMHRFRYNQVFLLAESE